jgi:hypothetical protein
MAGLATIARSAHRLGDIGEATAAHQSANQHLADHQIKVGGIGSSEQAEVFRAISRIEAQILTGIKAARVLLGAVAVEEAAALAMSVAVTTAIKSATCAAIVEAPAAKLWQRWKRKRKITGATALSWRWIFHMTNGMTKRSTSAKALTLHTFCLRSKRRLHQELRRATMRLCAQRQRMLKEILHTGTHQQTHKESHSWWIAEHPVTL